MLTPEASENMATTVQGFGTSFVGQRDFWPDGSYITTEWVVLLFLPLIPLRSLRVTETTSEGGTPFYSKQGYLVRRELPIHLRQVLCVYGFLVFYVGLCALAAMASPLLPGHAAEIILVAVVIGTPWLVPWYARARAKTRSALGTHK